jgi:hypothetical protein
MLGKKQYTPPRVMTLRSLFLEAQVATTARQVLEDSFLHDGTATRCMPSGTSHLPLDTIARC